MIGWRKTRHRRRETPLREASWGCCRRTADGNQTLVKTKTGIWSVLYNGENRPIDWTCGAMNIVMKYDRMGRRVEYLETVSDLVDSTITTNKHQHFVYDNYLCIERLDASNTNSVTDVFVWDPTEPIATRPLQWQTPSDTYAYFHDGNKNVADVVPDHSAVDDIHYDYASFGEASSTSSNDSNPWRFSSEYYDESLRLSSYNYRDYDSSVGRWLSSDPLGESGGVNLYGFCENNPISYYDYQGEMLQLVVPAAVVVGIAAEEAIKETLIVVGLVTAAVVASDMIDNQRGCRRRCRPCNPSVGTIGYRIDLVPPSKPHWPYKGTHTHLYKVNQTPVDAGCECKWNRNNQRDMDGGIPPPGAIPVETPISGGGVELY